MLVHISPLRWSWSRNYSGKLLKAIGKLLSHCLENPRITIIAVEHKILLKDLYTLTTENKSSLL